MTYLRILFCAATISLLCASAPAADPAPATQPSTILRTDTPVKIDGVLDDPCWQAATPISVNYVFGKVGVADPVVPMIVKYAWDENYVYVGYETFDRNIVAVGTGEKQGPAGNQREGAEIDKPGQKVDVVEFFFSFGDPHFMWELHHNALNQFNDIFVCFADPNWPINKSTLSTYGNIFCVQEYLKDDGPSTVAMAVKLKPKADGKPSTPNDPSDEDTGYTAELRVPLRALGVMAEWHAPADPKTNRPAGWNMAGHQVSLLAVVQNGELDTRYRHSSPTFAGGWYHQGMKDWPVYQFVDTPTAKAGNP